MSDNEWLKAKRHVDAALHTPTNSLAEIARLRDHAAGLALERDGFQEECKRLRAALAAAQEREQRMREAGLLALKVAESWIHDQCDGTDALAPALAELDEARGTLSALGEPQ